MKRVPWMAILFLVSGIQPMARSQEVFEQKDALVKLGIAPLQDAEREGEEVVPATNGRNRVMVICGLPGDETHRERLTRALRQLLGAGQQVIGFDNTHRRVLVGDARMQDDLKVEIGKCEIATRESIRAAFVALGEQLQPPDSLWVFVLGHGNLYGKRSLFNVEGPDIDQNDFGELVKAVNCRRRIVWAMQPTSGFWLRPMAGPHSVLISATEAAYEITGTEMAYALGDVIAGEASNQSLEDIDQDGRLSAFDLYLATCLEVAARFTELERLQTEHAQLDDNGDGRGRELQSSFLPDSPQSRFSLRSRFAKGEGELARSIPIFQAPAPKSDDESSGSAEEEVSVTTSPDDAEA